MTARDSSGIDINEMIIGSEGNFGIITEAIFKVHKIPEVQEHGSYIFYDFESGTKFMKEVGQGKNWPCSFRLVDNTQFQFIIKGLGVGRKRHRMLVRDEV